ncbi:Bifunctional purine biosynthesis protein PurH [Phycisphaerae bacterium RAS2]|nr:Bifunctional purine biosynthesis protein PurH [Phycisphaerae bacterium RAS2]
MPTHPIRRALIAVYDKTGIIDFARALVDEFGIEIISTGGTAKHLKDASIPVTMVEEVTGFPELLDGRVKTLHPKIHAGILADRDNPEHMRQLAEHGIKPIDMVVVNLYPFEKTVADPACTFEDAIEMIDIGGPCMLRAAAKNHRHVLVVETRDAVDTTLEWLRDRLNVDFHNFSSTAAMRAFREVTRYDADITRWLGRVNPESQMCIYRFIELFDWGGLRYGENPSQQALLTKIWDKFFPLDLTIADTVNGDEPVQSRCSYNNYLDADAALSLCAELARSIDPSQRAAGFSPRGHSNASAGPLAPPTLDDPTWLLTWTTYGTWLPGDARGYVSRTSTDAGPHEIFSSPGQPYSADQPELSEAAKDRMAGEPVLLDAKHAATVRDAFIEASAAHNIRLVAFAIMPNHIHVLCQATQQGSELLQLFKGVSSRRLGQAFPLANSPRWWTKSGSTRHLKQGDDPTAAINYVCEQKHSLLIQCFDSERNRGDVHSHPGAARAEARGSFGEIKRVSEVVGAARAEARGSLAVACFIKHTNACGVGIDSDPIQAYRRAYLGDPNAAMGGILAVNFPVSAEFAAMVMETYDRLGKPLREAGASHAPGGFFVEVWVAPSFDEAAVEIIRGTSGTPASESSAGSSDSDTPPRPKKKWGENVRLLAVGDMTQPPSTDELAYRSIAGGMLVQTADNVCLNEDQWKVVTKRPPTESEMSDLRLAWLIAKHTKSNAISLCKDSMLIGNGAGQMSRVMSCRIATWLARENGHADKLAGSAAASDAFFPFADGPNILIDAGVTAIIQPGGSKRDEEVIRACDERGVAMIFTGTRHFKH